MYENFNLTSQQPVARGAFEINHKVAAQEEEAIRLARWYTDLMDPKAPRKTISAQSLINWASSLLHSLKPAPQQELASASQK